MKKQVIGLSILAMLLGTAPVFAASAQNTRLTGTVSAVDGEHLIVKDKAAKTTSVTITKDTKYFSGKAAAAASDVKVGKHVVVDVAGNTAKEIHLRARSLQSKHHKSAHQTHASTH